MDEPEHAWGGLHESLPARWTVGQPSPFLELTEALYAITEASKVTCYVCGKLGVRCAGRSPLVVSDSDSCKRVRVRAGA
ncbi:MAG TPA: hypothetical protein VJ850_08470 [Candidatus Limnocylindrales bacterium]|nr:hypothetical protein [Candidatus Limnocylindrales bacterium]